jgi:hypothetical protein
MGICLGFQLAVVEYARHVLGWSRATSAEFVANTEASSSPPASPALSDDTSPPTSPMARLALANNKSQQPQHVIISMPEVSITHLGGTMRIGARTSVVTPGSLTASIYGGATHIEERHRHRYEVNPTHVPALTKAAWSAWSWPRRWNIHFSGRIRATSSSTRAPLHRARRFAPLCVPRQSTLNKKKNTALSIVIVFYQVD